MITNIRQQGQQPDQSHDFEPTDLHGLYLRTKAAGYTRDLTLSACAAQSMAGRLRGVESIAALMLATSNEDDFKTSEYLRTGLVEALYYLTNDVHRVLELRNEEAREVAA